jgi:hypothetical protein
MARYLLMYCGICGAELQVPDHVPDLQPPEELYLMPCPGCGTDVQVNG